MPSTRLSTAAVPPTLYRVYTMSWNHFHLLLFSSLIFLDSLWWDDPTKKMEKVFFIFCCGRQREQWSSNDNTMWMIAVIAQRLLYFMRVIVIHLRLRFITWREDECCLTFSSSFVINIFLSLLFCLFVGVRINRRVIGSLRLLKFMPAWRLIYERFVQQQQEKFLLLLIFQTVWHIQLVIKLIKNADRIYMQQEGPISIVWMAIGYIDSIVDIGRSTGDSSADRRGPSPFALHTTRVETARHVRK